MTTSALLTTQGLRPRTPDRTLPVLASRDPRAVRLPGVTAVEVSHASKLGLASATYVTQESCDPLCAFIGGDGCYAEEGRVVITEKRLTSQVASLPREARTPLAIARNEAAAIRGLAARLPLRLHVVGDARTPEAARELSAAAADYTSRHGQPVWTFTHSWRDVARSDWGGVSVLASCETPSQVRLARRRGYATALVIGEFPVDSDGRRDRKFTVAGESVIPCPQQTRGIQCTDCGLCLDAGKLRAMKVSIGFETHGRGARRARATLARVAGKRGE